MKETDETIRDVWTGTIVDYVKIESAFSKMIPPKKCKFCQYNDVVADGICGICADTVAGAFHVFGCRLRDLLNEFKLAWNRFVKRLYIGDDWSDDE